MKRRLQSFLILEIVVFIALFYFFDACVNAGYAITRWIGNNWDLFLTSLSGGPKY